MKKILFLFAFLCVAKVTNAQEYKIEEKSVTGVFEVGGKTKSDIFSLINKWISINYNSSKNVIQMNDSESGTIIIKGINEVKYKNTAKTLYPNNKYIPEFYTTKFNHLIEVNAKDGKFRIIFRILDIASENVGYNDITFNCVNFNGTNDAAIVEYNTIMEETLKKGLVGSEKRETFKTLTKPMFLELSESLINDIKLTMTSVEKTVKETSNNSW
jgi:hypothetical protein